MKTKILYIKKQDQGKFSFEEVVSTFTGTDDLNMIREAVENADDRVYVSWATVDVRDKDGEKVPIDDVIRDQDVLLNRNGPITDQHTNAVVGETVAYKVLQHPQTGKTGVLHLNRIWSDNEIDDLVWTETQSGKRQGSSVGGFSKRDAYEKDPESGLMTRIREDFHQYETANVYSPANPWALNEAVSLVAKSFKDVDDQVFIVEKNGKKYKVTQKMELVDGEKGCKQKSGKGESVINKLSQRNIQSTMKNTEGDLMDKEFIEKVDQYGQDISELKKGVEEIKTAVLSLAKQDPEDDKNKPKDPEPEEKKKQEEEKPDEEEDKKAKKEVDKDEAASDIDGMSGKEKPDAPTPDDSNDEDVFKEHIKKQNKVIEDLQKEMKEVAKKADARPSSSPKVEHLTKEQKERLNLPLDMAMGKVIKTWNEVHKTNREMLDEQSKNAGIPQL